MSSHTVFALTILLVISDLRAGDTTDVSSYGLDHRVPWTNDRMVGSPDPPPPFTVEKRYTGRDWKTPIYLIAEPDTQNLVVVENGSGNDRPTKLLRVPIHSSGKDATTLFEAPELIIYGLAFHPEYAANGFIYVFSNGPTGNPERKNRITRYTVDRTAPYSLDRQTGLIIIEWRSMGHDGGELAFGHDGMLYISTGDGTSDSDNWNSGQDLSNLLGAVLRIDVRESSEDQPYLVPPTNPFLELENARPEIWAYGLRNPWRLTVDRQSGQIWVGNNGQDLWETAHLIGRGENYGWSVYEGSYPFYLNRKRGPTPIVKPTIEHHHSEFRSLTGGVVYYGDRHPDINGVYVYGDHSTGKIWGARHNGDRLTWHQELADTTLQIAAFAIDPNGDLLIADYGGGIYRLIPKESTDSHLTFPTRLSQTGLFESVTDHKPHPGLIPYSVNAPAWADGATAERFMGVPSNLKINYTTSRGWNFPDGSILLQTLSMPQTANDGSKSSKRIETRLLLKQQGEWAGYSYQWNEDQTDAVLAPKNGLNLKLKAKGTTDSARGSSPTAWRIPSRTECMVCHSRAANFVLGLSQRQMNKRHNYGNVRDNQLRALDNIGLFNQPLPKDPSELESLISPYDETADIERRARSYLHANCSVCHVNAGGGNSRMELEFTRDRTKMEVIGARPQHDTFGIQNAMIVAPGFPERSVLLHRISRSGGGRMPPLGSIEVDRRAVKLFRTWIAQMESTEKVVNEWTLEDLLPVLDRATEDRDFESGRSAFETTGCVQCHRLGDEGGVVGPDLTNIGQRMSMEQLLEAIVEPSKTISEDYASFIVETNDEQIVSGRIARQTDQAIVFEPTSQFEEPTIVNRADIATIKKSAESNMPGGMINTLTQDQVLDLLAFLKSGSTSD